jgi:hypothetical protein
VRKEKTKKEQKEKVRKQKKSITKKHKTGSFLASPSFENRKLSKKTVLKKKIASAKSEPYHLGTLWEMDPKEVLADFIEREVENHQDLGETYSKINSFIRLKKKAIKKAKWAGVFTLKSFYRLAITCVVAVFIYQFLPGALSAPKSVTITSKADWDLGQTSGVTSENSIDSIQMKPAGAWNARAWTPPEDIISFGHTSVMVNDYLYVFRGYSGNAFWRYDTINNKWATMAGLPVPAFYGADMVYSATKNKIYAIFGGYSQGFYSYDISLDTWTKLADLLDTPWTGATMEIAGNSIFVARGNATVDFWLYDIPDDDSEGMWDSRPPVPLAVSAGADLVNGQDGNLYMVRGNGSQNFYRYNIAGRRWYATVAQLPSTCGAGATACTFSNEQRGVYWNHNLYFMRSNGTQDILQYNITGNTWTALATDVTPQPVNFGSLTLNTREDLIYAFRANATTDFWKFDPDAAAGQRWVGPKQVQDAVGNLRAVGTGGDLIWNQQSGANGALYAFVGIGTTNFYKFDITNNAWLSAGSTPGFTFNNDIKGTAKSDGSLYMLRTGNTAAIVNIMIGGTWSPMIPQPSPNTPGDGAGLAFAGSDLYYMRGGSSTCMYKYSAGAWGSCVNIAVVEAGTTITYYPNVGSRIISDGTNIYVMPGNGETAFLKYSAGTWSKMTPTPFSQYYGTDMTYNSSNGRIYAIAGFYKDETWEFYNNIWRKLPNNQKFTFGRGPYNGASIEYAGGNSIYATIGQGVGLPSASADMWNFTVPATNYPTEADTYTYTSHKIDLGQVSTGVSFTFNQNAPIGTAVKYELCSNTDGSSCTSWHNITDGVINDLTINRYAWIKITLSTDGASTPTVSDYTISYTNSDTRPGTPTGIIAKSQQTGGTNIISGTEYSYEHPYFSWSAGADNGSGVAGYYVYFGNNSSANPETEGTYQTVSSYSVNEAMSYDTSPIHDYGTYYLVVKAKDNNGLVSDALTAFTYKYGGVSPYQSYTKTSQADFTQAGADFNGGNIVASTSPDSLKLANISGFWKQPKLSAAAVYTYVGSEMAQGGCKAAGNSLNGNHCLYTFQGNNTQTFEKYEIETDTWTSYVSPSQGCALATVYNGGSMVEGEPGYIYGSRGNATSTFWRYDIAANTWSDSMTVDIDGTPTSIPLDAPKPFDYGSVLVYDNVRYIYGMPGNDDAFFRFDTCYGASDCVPGWTQLRNANFGNPNSMDGQKTNEGADAIYDGRNNIYVSQGNYYPYFAKYSIADDPSHGETADAWTPLSTAPSGFLYGGSLGFDGDHSIYALAGNQRMKFYKYDMNTDTWSSLADAPAFISYGASIAVYNNYLYVTRGGTYTNFYRYSIADNTWETPTRDLFGPHNVDGSIYFPFGSGAFMAEDGAGNIYLNRGGLDTTFGKYNVTSGTFTSLSKLPVGASTGSSLVYSSNDNAVYYVTGSAILTRRSGGDTKNAYFFKYDIATNSWTEITSDRPIWQIAAGSSMTHDGARYVYMTQGGANGAMWKYDTQNVGIGTTISPTGACQSNDGSKILYSGSTIYKIQAGASRVNCKWSGGTWITLGLLPANVSTGAALMDGKDGYIYVTAGGNVNPSAYYRYATSQTAPGAWENLSSTPAPNQISTGGVGVNSLERNWVIAGAGSGQTLSDGIYSYVVGSSSRGTGFVKTGTYISEPIDRTQVYRWANLTVEYVLPEGTALEIETRSSANGSSWGSWSDASNEHAMSGNMHVFNINSDPNRYIQVKFVFSSSTQIYSPRVDSYTINYYQDTALPTGPSAVTAYRGVGNTATITNPSGNSWFNLTAPQFTWPNEGEANGASDGTGGSGVAGYYVCFGTSDDCADAYADGTYQPGNSFTAPTLASSVTDHTNSGKTYYLRVAAVDNAGWPSASYTGFVYNFDNNPPSNPSTLSVNPTGYSSNSFFTMSWTDDASDDHSDINRLEYCTNCDPTDPLEFPDIEWTPIGDGLLSLDVAPYQGNENTFYLRVLDGAGNASTATPKFFYYTGGAASPPTALTVDPDDVNNGNNSFTFTWDTPASYGGDPTKIKYYYSINVPPNAYNVIETTAKSAGPGPFATQYGENTFYIVAMSEGGNKFTDGDIDWAHPARKPFYAKTTAPGPPLNAQIFDTSDKETEEYSLALKWSTPTSYDSGNFAGYSIFRSDTETGIFTEIATTTGTAFVDTGLASRVYYYYVKSRDKTNNFSVATSTVHLIPTGRYTRPPTIVAEPSAVVQSFASTVTWSTNRVCSSFIEYGSSSTMDKTNGQVDSVTSHTVSLTGLSAATKYYYRAKFIDPDGNIGTSDVLSFTTNDPPTISEVTATEIGLNTATVSWNTNMSGTCTLKYGKGSFTSTIEESAGGTSHIQKLSSLESATSYSYQIDCEDADLNTFSSDQYTFVTLEQSLVSDMTVQNVMDVNIPTIQVNYTTNHNTSTLVKFKGSNESSYHNYLTADLGTAHEAKIEGLDPAIEYEVIATGIDENGLEALPQTQKVTTLTDSRPPAITTNRAVGKVVGRGKDARANLYVKIETDEISVVKVMFGKGIVLSNFEQSTAEDPANTYHMITIPVEPGQVYSYVVSAKDPASNEAISKPATVVIENAKENATEIVVSTFSNKFGWVSKLWTR